MAIWRPDPSFYPSPRTAMHGPREKLAYVAVLNPSAALSTDGHGRPDALAVFDLDPDSETYGQVVGRVDMPNTGDELHHFGWNACSSALCPYAPHPHIERRYLIVPGLRSSRLHVIDTKPEPREPRIVKVIEPDELHERTGYSRPHTIHCGPEGIYVSALGAPDGDRKSTRLNSSHANISYAVFCLKKKKRISLLIITSMLQNTPHILTYASSLISLLQ